MPANDKYGLPILPVMQCDKCCTVVPCNDYEYKLVVAYAEAKGIVPIKQGCQCPWYQDGACSVYEVRPAICRVFGHADDPFLTCPRGYNVNVPGRRIREILDKYSPRHKGEIRYLHEVLGDGWEAIALEKLSPSDQAAVAILFRK